MGLPGGVDKWSGQILCDCYYALNKATHSAKPEKARSGRDMPFEGEVKIIKVVEIKRTKFDDGGELVTILADDKKKYKINKTNKTDGQQSVAWGQMQELGLDFVGSTIEVGFKEVPAKPFTDPKTGKLVEYTNRYVSFLKKVEDKTEPKQSEQSPDEEVTVEDIPF